MLENILIIYFICISLVAIVVTVYDKLSAIRNRWRISERTLFAISALGGSVAMLITMLLIRHKTRKASFMVTVPLIIVLQIAVVVFVMVKI